MTSNLKLDVGNTFRCRGFTLPNPLVVLEIAAKEKEQGCLCLELLGHFFWSRVVEGLDVGNTFRWRVATLPKVLH